MKTLTQDQVLKAYLYICYLKRNATFGIFVDRRDHAKQISEEIRRLHTTVPDWVAPKLERYTIGTIELDNGSRIYIQHGCHGKGLSLSGVAIWEKIQNLDEVLKCVIPCVFPVQEAVVLFS